MEGLNERQQRLVELVNKFHYVTIKQLVKEFGVSEMTVRRDISVLSTRNLILQVYGGALSLTYRQGEKKYSVSQELSKNTLLKKSIAQKALDLLSPNDVLFLDSGTTVQALAELIPKDSLFTIISSSFNTLEVLVKLPNCSIISPGGLFSQKSTMFYNTDAATFYKKHRANKCFIGATGFDIEHGLTCSYMEDISNKQWMIESSQEKILLLDSTKYDKVSTFVFAGIEEFSTIITDRSIPNCYVKKINDMGINLFIVD